MDVRCSRCSTEYELDDSRVAASGTTVKCSSCGHVFKVMPGGRVRDSSGAIPRTNTHTPVLGSVPSPGSPSQSPSQNTAPNPSQNTTSPPAPTGEWMVKKADGQVFRFRELTTLQKWIVERKVAKPDEISRTGRSWKRLGEIAELASFFQVVEAADAAQRVVTASQMPQIHLTATPTGTFQAFPLPTPGVGGGAGGGFSPASVPPTEPFVPAPPPGAAPPRVDPSQQPQPQPQAARAPSTSLASSQLSQSDSLALDDDDPVLAWQRRRQRVFRLTAAIAVFLVVVAVVVVVRGLPGSGLPEATQASAQRALKEGTPAVVTAAETALKAHTGPASQALRARLGIARAQSAQEASRLLAEQVAVLTPVDGATPTAPRAKLLANANAQAAGLAKRAEKDFAGAAAVIVGLRASTTVAAEADLAAADLALAKQDLAGVQKDTALARDHAKTRAPSFIALVDDEVRLLLTLAEAATLDVDDDVTAAKVEKAAGVIGKLGRFDDVRARAQQALTSLHAVRLAAQVAGAQTPPVAVDAGVIKSALAAFVALPAEDPRRLAGEALLAVYGAPPLPPEPVAEEGDGKDDDDGKGDGKDDGKGDGKDDGKEDGDTSTPAASFESLMRDGQKAADRGSSRSAYGYFRKAVALEPGNAQAHLKLGWAALDISRTSEAVRSFRKAAANGVNEAQFGLAEGLRFSGDKAGAVEAYQRYLELEPTGRDAKVAKNAIDQLSE